MAEIGVAVQYWGAVERGEKSASIEQLARMAEVVGMTLEVVYTLRKGEKGR